MLPQKKKNIKIPYVDVCVNSSAVLTEINDPAVQL